MNKTADSDAVFSKVSPLAIFAGNEIREKYHVTFFLEKKHVGQKGGHEGVPEGQKRWPMRPLYLAAWAHPKWASGTTSPPVFDVPLHIREKNACPRGGRSFRETHHRHHHVLRFGDRLIQDFSSGGGVRRPSSPPSSPPSPSPMSSFSIPMCE